MKPITVEVDIDHGRLTAKEPERLPEKGSGVLTVLPSSDAGTLRSRVKLPLVRCSPGTIVNPTAEELDASLWD